MESCDEEVKEICENKISRKWSKIHDRPLESLTADNDSCLPSVSGWMDEGTKHLDLTRETEVFSEVEATKTIS